MWQNRCFDAFAAIFRPAFLTVYIDQDDIWHGSLQTFSGGLQVKKNWVKAEVSSECSESVPKIFYSLLSIFKTFKDDTDVN